MNNVQKAVVIVIAVVLCAGVAYTVLGNDDIMGDARSDNG